MVKKIIFCFGVVVSSYFNAQVLDEYPKNQDFYEGGEVALYKDIHQVLKDSELQPCEDKKQIYLVKLLITEDGTIKYIKDDINKEYAESNKCAYNLGLKAVSKMNKWKPLMINGEKKSSIASFHIFPDALFDKYKEGYVLQSTDALFEGSKDGINKFRSVLVKKIDISGFQWKEAFKLVSTFVVNKEGTIEDIKLENSSGVAEFDQRIINGIKSVKKKWTPATIEGMPVKYRFRLPLSFRATE